MNQKTESHEEMMARLFPGEFNRQMQELSKAVAKFETAVDRCTQAIADFKAKI